MGAANGDMSPFSVDAFNKYTETQRDEDRKVYMWHLHAYSPKNDEAALKQLQGAITSRFTDEPQFRYGHLAMDARGPHPCAQMEFDFTRHIFADVISWAMWNRPEDISILIHPLDDHQVEAHSTRAMWLGKPLDLKLEPMRTFDAMLAKKVASGGTAAANEVFSKMSLSDGAMGLLAALKIFQKTG